MCRWILVVAVLLIACVGAGEKGVAEVEEVEDVILIQVGQTSYRYLPQYGEGDDKYAIPDVPIGHPFRIRVDWRSDSESVQTLRLSSFRAFVPDTELISTPSRDSRGPIWSPLQDGELEVSSDDDSPLEYGIELVNGKEDAATGRTFKISNDRVEEMVDAGEIVLIFFDVELENASGTTVFSFDPPWAGKKR